MKLIILFLALAFASCQTPAIQIQQKAVCVYNDGKKAEFEYARTEHLNSVKTTFTSKAGNYEVGRKYIVIIKLK